MWYAAIDRVQFFSVTSIKKPLLLYKWTVNIAFKQFSKLTSDDKYYIWKVVVVRYSYVEGDNRTKIMTSVIRLDGEDNLSRV